MEQMLQNEPTELSVQAVPQKAVEQACFHALTLISRNCEYLDQHLARTGADQESRQAVTDISAASAQLDRTVNEVMTLLEYLRAEELPRLYPMDLCDLLQQIAAQADMVQEQLKVELTLDYGGFPQEEDPGFFDQPGKGVGIFCGGKDVLGIGAHGLSPFGKMGTFPSS